LVGLGSLLAIIIPILSAGWTCSTAGSVVIALVVDEDVVVVVLLDTAAATGCRAITAAGFFARTSSQGVSPIQPIPGGQTPSAIPSGQGVATKQLLTTLAQS
jgi:hypothetical protein